MLQRGALGRHLPRLGARPIEFSVPNSGPDAPQHREAFIADRADEHRLEDRARSADRESAESTVLMDTLLSAAPMGFAFVDRDLRLVRINDRLAVNCASGEDQTGRTVAEAMPTIWPQIEPSLRSVLDSGPPVRGQEIVGDSAAPGQVFSWLASFYPVRVAAEVIGVVAIMVEGLERRPVTPREQEEEFRSAVIANMTEGLFAFDRERRLTFLNAAASKMIGWSENELRGRSVHAAIQFQHPDGSVLTEERSEMVSVLKLGRSIRGQTGAFTRKDGSIFPVAYSAAPLIDHGDVTGVVVVFRDTTEEWAEQREMKRALDELEWVGRTRDALDDGKLKLYSQPIIPLAGDKPSEELLIRMVGREGEIIRPAVFLPAAEKYGLIGDIDKWVVTQAARLAGDGRCVHANLSALSISNLHLLAHIERALSAASANPSNLVFEITETALVEDLDAGAAFARGLSDIGCDLALDDFGTGYGSFSILKKLPIKYLKIDIEFVLDLVSNRSNQHVVKAIVGLAEGFGQQTVAEGVEDAATLALLEEYGVDFAQGYHLGRPTGVAEPPSLRRRSRC